MVLRKDTTKKSAKLNKQKKKKKIKEKL